MRLSIESSSSEASQQLRLLELCFEYSFLNGRARAGQLSPDAERRLINLRPLFEGDPTLKGRRRHRRYGTYLPAALEAEQAQGHGILLNFSGGGMLLATLQPIPAGTDLVVRVGSPGKVEYQFSCRVIRTIQGRTFNGLACCLVGPPLELTASPPATAPN